MKCIQLVCVSTLDLNIYPSICTCIYIYAYICIDIISVYHQKSLSWVADNIHIDFSGDNSLLGKLKQYNPEIFGHFGTAQSYAATHRSSKGHQ